MYKMRNIISSDVYKTKNEQKTMSIKTKIVKIDLARNFT